MPGADPDTLNEMIGAALGQLPEDADILLLGYSAEACSYLRYSESRPNIARATRPIWSGGSVFTRKGATKIVELTYPIFDTLAKMVQWFVSQGQLEAYVMTPPAFYQIADYKDGVIWTAKSPCVDAIWSKA
mmetsp:Transcript_27889/g.43523  ORF Transcript_27889/g.43523 Transcript_27889/m.43523 type:complete len:131 (-) Transcript_27889:2175-2567(-)